MPTEQKTLKLIYSNVQSLPSKIGEINCLVANHNPDILIFLLFCYIFMTHLDWIAGA